MITTTIDKNDLITKYEECTGKKNGKFLSIEKLQSEIDRYDKTYVDTTTIKKTWDEMTEEERMKEAQRINSYKPNFYEEKITPVFLDGEPHAIINNEYVSWKEAKKIQLAKEIKVKQAQLAAMQ